MPFLVAPGSFSDLILRGSATTLPMDRLAAAPDSGWNLNRLLYIWIQAHGWKGP